MTDMSLYNANRSKLKFGDLLQWSGTSILSKAIQSKTENDRPQYEKDHDINASHSSLLVTMPIYEGMEHRVWTTEAVENGTVLHLLSKNLDSYNGKLWWYPLKDDIGSEDFRKQVGINAFELIGIPYAFEDLFTQLAGRVKIDIKNLFCSEYCQVCYLGIDKAIGQVALNPNQMATLGIFEEPILIFHNP